MKTLLTGVALLIASGLPIGALAQTARPPADMQIIAVSYDDLDLAQPAGSRILNNRLRSAAQQMCGDSNLVTLRPRERHWCVRQTVANGWSQVAANRSIQLAEKRIIALSSLSASSQP